MGVQPIMHLNGGGVQNIIALDPRTVPCMDMACISKLRHDMGYKASQELVERVAFELSDRLYLLNLALVDNDLRQVERMAKSIIAMSMQIGLSDFSRAAYNLSDCVMSGDGTSIAAVHARLDTVGEMSLAYAIELCQMPI